MLLVSILPLALGLTPKTPVYQDPAANTAVRVQDLVSRMTLQEKIDMLGGTGFATKTNSRLGIPDLKMTDGPLGVRWWQSTAFPSGIAMSASFDRDLIRQVTGAMGEEVRAKGRDMLLGPCVGISRIPFGGRNFESMGEDPYLTSEMAGWYVKGLRDVHVVGSVKHFALNDQEYRRNDINSVSDERTMHEIHFPAYQRAIDEGVGTVMASYNLVDGKHSTENDYLLNQVLKKQWGFKGFVISDWVSVYSTVPAALAGLDLEMPFPSFFDSKLLDAVTSGAVPESLIDDKVSRILTVMMDVGLFDGADKNRPDPSIVNNQVHRDLALQMAREAHVLLKNQNHLLPFDVNTIKSIGVIGPNGGIPRTGGGGSSMVQPFNPVSIAEGLQSHVGEQTKIAYAIGVQLPMDVAPIETYYLTPAQGEGHGLYLEIFNNKDLEGDPVATRIDPSVNFSYDDTTSPSPAVSPSVYSMRWTGTLTAPVTGTYELRTQGDDGVRLYIDDELAIDDWNPHGPTIDSKKLWFLAGHTYKIRLEYFQDAGNAIIQLGWVLPAQLLREEAIRVARTSDVVVLTVGFTSDLESEAEDRSTFSLPAGQDQLIDDVLKANPKTVLVVNSGNPIDMHRWIDKAAAIIYAWYPGEQGGNALADIVLGNFNPSGRLPVTMLKRWEDAPENGTYPEQDGNVNYKEGIYVGYRYYDTKKVEPYFPFGHGLSYTQFEYTNVIIKANDVSPDHPDFDVLVTITNTGKMAGAEVAQLYVHDQTPHVDRPMQELKEFQRVFLQPGESKQVKMKLDRRSFSYYDVTIHDWKAWAGQYTLRVGPSSRDIRLQGDVELGEDSKTGV
jgi:beta-glucosidase